MSIFRKNAQHCCVLRYAHLYVREYAHNLGKYAHIMRSCPDLCFENMSTLRYSDLCFENMSTLSDIQICVLGICLHSEMSADVFWEYDKLCTLGICQYCKMSGFRIWEYAHIVRSGADEWCYTIGYFSLQSNFPYDSAIKLLVCHFLYNDRNLPLNLLSHLSNIFFPSND